MPVESRDDLVKRLDRWRATFGEPMGNGRSNPDNDMIYLLRDIDTRIESDAKRIAALEAAFLQSQTDLQNAIGDRDEAIIQQTFAEDRAIIAERALAEERERCAVSLTTDEMIEAACLGMYGKNWIGPPDKQPGEAMKDVWRKYARDCLAEAATAIRSGKPVGKE